MQPEDLLRMCEVLRHRLRNIASGIRGAVSLIQEETQGQIANDLQEYFPLMVKECESLQDMANRLGMVFDNPNLQPSTETVQNITNAILDDIAPQFPHVEFRKDYPQEALAAPVAMGTALQELIRNACEAAPKGTVGVQATDIEKKITWRVLDDGTAMDEEVRKKIFMPFFTTRPRHLGLGLSIARRIAKMHNGDCRLIQDDETPSKYAFELTCNAAHLPTQACS